MRGPQRAERLWVGFSPQALYFYAYAYYYSRYFTFCQCYSRNDIAYDPI